jgi:hypothetical protein
MVVDQKFVHSFDKGPILQGTKFICIKKSRILFKSFPDYFKMDLPANINSLSKNYSKFVDNKVNLKGFIINISKKNTIREVFEYEE